MSVNIKAIIIQYLFNKIHLFSKLCFTGEIIETKLLLEYSLIAQDSNSHLDT